MELRIKIDFGDPLAVSFFGDNYDSLHVVINQQALGAHFATDNGQKVIFKDDGSKKAMKKLVPL